MGTFPDLQMYFIRQCFYTSHKWSSYYYILIELEYNAYLSLYINVYHHTHTYICTVFIYVCLYTHTLGKPLLRVIRIYPILLLLIRNN